MSFMTSQISHPYKSTDFTQALNIFILVPFRSDFDSHTLLNLENETLGFCILALLPCWYLHLRQKHYPNNRNLIF